MQGRKLVLAGDHKQLPPTIMCKHSQVQAGLGKTLFERLMKLYGDDQIAKASSKGEHSAEEPRVSRMLNTQYRMHENISNWASKASYHGALLTHASVKDRTIGQLVKQQMDAATKNVDDNKTIDGVLEDDVVSDVAMLLVDTAGCGMYESESSSGSRFNEGEAQVVAKHVQALLDKGMHQYQIAIITPYNGQVELLRTMLLPDHPKLEIRSVDGFQGGEREAVVLSLVRSSDKRGASIGFLRDNRRLNVAITRAKRHCCIICDTETVSQSAFVKGLIEWSEEHGEQRSAMDFLAGSSEMINDLRDAEIELQKGMAELAKSEKNRKINVEKESKASYASAADDEAKRKELLDRIARFAETGEKGQEMALSAELTSYDRRVVHEFAEQIGLGHYSEGEGVNRRIALTIEKAVTVAVAPLGDVQEELPDQAENDAPLEPMPEPSTAFAALALDGHESESDADDDAAQDATEPTGTFINLLAELAKERENRAKQQHQAAQTNPPACSKSKGNYRKKKGKKLGGEKSAPEKDDDGLDDLDDFAFLDKQIEKVQTSHGRKVTGTGQGYRTVINGILISTPAPPEKEKNTRASSALQSKLKKAQDGRKAKSKKKK